MEEPSKASHLAAESPVLPQAQLSEETPGAKQAPFAGHGSTKPLVVGCQEKNRHKTGFVLLLKRFSDTN